MVDLLDTAGNWLLALAIFGGAAAIALWVGVQVCGPESWRMDGIRPRSRTGKILTILCLTGAMTFTAGMIVSSALQEGETGKPSIGAAVPPSAPEN